MDEMTALIEPRIPDLRRYAFALTRNRDLADDLVQDCLERAVRRWHQRGSDANVRAWLFAILHNVFVSHLRYCSRRGAQFGLAGFDGETIPMTTDPIQEVQLVVRDALAGLAFLPVEQREILLLVGVEEMSYAEASQVLDVPIGTVMSRLSRGRESLRRFLEGGQAAPVSKSNEQR
jgi:RNA polymerase sigma factor (sigma-70 family)